MYHFSVFIDVVSGLAHKLHLVICNGFGLWIRKRKATSGSTTSTKSTNSTEIGSDEEDLIGDFSMESNLESNNSVNSIDCDRTLLESMDTSD